MGIHNFQKKQITTILTPRTQGLGHDLGDQQKMYLQGRKTSLPFSIINSTKTPVVQITKGNTT